MSAAEPTVSVILVSWNTRGLLDACLRSLRPEVEDINGEVWVVDNNSADGSPDMVAAGHPWVHLIRNDTNAGFARACNLVFPQLQSRYVFLFNPDAVLDSGALKILSAAMASHPEMAAMCPRMLDRNGQPTHFAGRASRLSAARLRIERSLIWKLSRFAPIRAHWERAARTYLSHSPTTGVYPRNHVEGAALFVRLDALRSAGWFDPSFFCGWEETDLTIRLRSMGWQVGVCADAAIRHWDQQSRLQWKTRHWEIADSYYFARKHGGTYGLLRHAARERRLMKMRWGAGEDRSRSLAEHERVLQCLLKSPEHPGYDWWDPNGAESPQSRS
jgi:GT2 family glycosyltransferase